jgi:hypothetical protein
MEVSTLSPSPSPDRILSIALAVIAIFGVVEVASVGFYYVGRARTGHVAAQPKAPPVAQAAPVAAPQTTQAPVNETQSIAAPPASIQSTPSAAVLSAAERLLKDATLLREQGDTTNALARLQEAAQSDPKNPNVLAQMAMIYESLQLPEKSTETWQKIVEIGPSAGSLYELADMKLKNVAPAPPNTNTGSGTGAASTSTSEASKSNDSESIPDGSTFGITDLTATDTPDPDAETNMKLKISVKARPNTAIDHTKVKIQVFFYDTTDNQDAVLTDADVSYEWLTPHHDWTDTNPEVLAVTYLRPKNKPISSEQALSIAASGVTPGGSKKKSKKEASAESTTDAGHRKYLGYIVRIYYLDQLQAVRAEPTKLLNLFPPPFTAPQQ